jgi:hypothetical protein
MQGRRRHRACEPAALSCDDTPEWVRQLNTISRCASRYASTDTRRPAGPGRFEICRMQIGRTRALPMGIAMP